MVAQSNTQIELEIMTQRLMDLPEQECLNLMFLAIRSRQDGATIGSGEMILGHLSDTLEFLSILETWSDEACLTLVRTVGRLRFEEHSARLAFSRDANGRINGLTALGSVEEDPSDKVI